MLTQDDLGRRKWADPVSRALIDLAAGRPPATLAPVESELVALAQKHGLIGVLANHTDDLLTRAVFGRAEARRDILERHLLRILTRFHEAGIRVSVLKGPAVASLYEKREHRAFGDLDLLVQESQLDMALELLETDEASSGVPPKTPKADKRNAVLADESGVTFNVDLHWDLFSYSQLRGCAAGATDEAWEMASPLPDSALGPYWQLPMAHRMAFLCTHAVLDHRFRLVLFRDFVEIARRDPNWSELGEMARRWQLASTTYLALWISAELLGAHVPNDFLSSIRPRSAVLTYLERAIPKLDLARFDGHNPHPVNLAAVLLHDSPSTRLSLLARAPKAFPGWRRRIRGEVDPSAPPRVLIIVSTDRRRGAEVFTERLREGLARQGWVISAVSLYGFGEEPSADLEPLVELTNGKPKRFDPTVVLALRRKLSRFQPDIVLANGGATLRHALVALIGRPQKLSYVSIGEPSFWIRSSLSRWMNRFLLRRTDQILAVSEATSRQLLELEPSLEEAVVTTFTGVPESLFKTPIQLGSGPLRVLIVGSLTAEKNPLRALHVAAAIQDAEVRFVGDGPLKSALLSEAGRLEAEFAVKSRLDLVGSVADVTPHLQWAHVLLLTSLSEGLPGAILEAGAAGVPTVAVDVGGVSEAIEDGVSGMVVESDDNSLIESLALLDSDRELLTRMGIAARTHIRDNFALATVLEGYRRALEGLLR